MKYIGKLVTGDFEENTMTFEIKGEMILQAGKYSIEQIEAGNQVKNLGIVDVSDCAKMNKAEEILDKHLEHRIWVETIPKHGNLYNTLLDAVNEALSIANVVSSAWYCEVSNINGQWFEIVTGKNEMEVCIKIEKRFGKGTKYQLIDKYELM